VTHSDRVSNHFGQKLTPSDQRSEKCVKSVHRSEWIIIENRI